MLFKLLAAVPLLAQAAVGAAIAAAPGNKNMVYYANWDVYADYPPQKLNAPYITHVLYAFGDINPQGEVIPSDDYADYQMLHPGDVQEEGTNAYGNIKQLYLLKKKNRKLKTLLSIGGFTNSQLGKFDAAAKTAAGRKRFANSAVKLMADWGFDGIDIDWEYPTWIQDGENLALLLQECRAALNAYAAKNGQTYRYLLTVATSAGPAKYVKLPLAKINQHVDVIHLMSYDYAGDWDTTTGHQSNIWPDPKNPTATKFSTSKAVNDYLAKGVSPKKLILGLPLYGRSFANTAGLGKPFRGTGKGSVEKGVWNFKDLPRPGATIYTNNQIGASHTYDAKTKELVTFDGAASGKLKANYVKNRGLGGAFFWRASGDKLGTASLVRIMAESMGNLDQSMNQLNYPASKFENMKKGMPPTPA